MDEVASTDVESSLLLWVLAAAVAVLAAHVGLGWVLRGQRDPHWRKSWRAALLAGATLGSGICASAVLMHSAEPLRYPLGYHHIHVAGLWLGACIGCSAVAFALISSQRWWAVLLTGALFAALACSLQIGWLVAAGLRPGIHWRGLLVAGAAVLMTVGVTTAMWVAFAESEGGGKARPLWLLSAYAVLTLSLVAAQEVLNVAAGLVTQIGSVYLREVPGSMLSLVSGVLVPLILCAMAMDLYVRNQRRRSSSSFAPQRRRKRRHKVRSL